MRLLGQICRTHGKRHWGKQGRCQPLRKAPRAHCDPSNCFERLSWSWFHFIGRKTGRFTMLYLSFWIEFHLLPLCTIWKIFWYLVPKGLAWLFLLERFFRRKPIQVMGGHAEELGWEHWWSCLEGLPFASAKFNRWINGCLLRLLSFLELWRRISLQELFEQFGTITSSAVPLDSNGKCKAGKCGMEVLRSQTACWKVQITKVDNVTSFVKRWWEHWNTP